MRYSTYIPAMVLLIILLISELSGMAQSEMDSASLRNLKGLSRPFAAITAKDSLILICFWSTNSDETINELNEINKEYDDWIKRARFRMLAVCVDQGKEGNRAKGITNMNGWKFDVYTDYAGDFQKAADVRSLPFSMILKLGKKLYQLNGYEPGSEKYLIQKLESISKGRQ